MRGGGAGDWVSSDRDGIRHRDPDKKDVLDVEGWEDFNSGKGGGDDTGR